MDILLTNDDGWGKKGLLILVKALAPLGHITVVAPDGPRSGIGTALSIDKPLHIQQIESPFKGMDVDVYLTNGTPGDCIKLGLNLLYWAKGTRPTFIASGINHGSNASINAVYSGTLGACKAGAEHGILGIGYSLCDYSEDPDFEPFTKQIIPLTKELLTKENNTYGLFYNINAPSGEIKGSRYTRQCHGHWDKELEKLDDGYYLVGEFINEEPDDVNTDEGAITQGYISITPMTIDCTIPLMK